MTFDYQYLSKEPLIFMLMHSGAFVCILGFIFFVVGMLFGFATWGRYKRLTRLLQSEAEAMKEEIAVLKRKIGDHSIKSGPTIPMATETIHMPRKEKGEKEGAPAATVAPPAAKTAPPTKPDFRPSGPPPAKLAELVSTKPQPKPPANIITAKAPPPAAQAVVPAAASAAPGVNAAPAAVAEAAAVSVAPAVVSVAPAAVNVAPAVVNVAPVVNTAPVAANVAPVVNSAPAAVNVPPAAVNAAPAPEAAPAPGPATASITLPPTGLPPPARHTSPLAAIIAAPPVKAEPESDAAATEPEAPKAAEGLVLADTIPALTEPAPELSVAPLPELETHPVLDSKLGLIYKTRPATVDDLTALKGISRVLEQRLNEIGVYTYTQIAAWDEDRIKEFSAHLSFKDRIQREHWVEQAGKLVGKQATSPAVL